jgi:4-amino-4-deoxy-L-arabinose transferase-like glycosyltransferase
MPAASTATIRAADGQRPLLSGAPEWAFVAVALAGAAMLRLWQLGRQPLWLDEGHTAAWVRGPWRECILADPFHPPLFHGLVKLFVLVFGLSETTLRVLPAIFGVLTVFATWLLLKRLLPEAARAGLVLAAVSPSLIYYSQEARDYQLFIFLSVLSTWAFVRFQQTGRGMALYALLSVCLQYSHWFGAMVLLAHEIVFWTRVRARCRQWLLARFLVLAGFLPWALWALTEVFGGIHFLGGSRPKHLLLRPAASWTRLLLGYGIAVGNFERRSQPLAQYLREDGPAVCPCLLLLGWLLLRGALRLGRETGTRELLACILLLPPVLALGVGATADRYLSFQAPFLLAVIAAGLAAVRGRARLLATLGCATVFSFALLAYYASPGSLFGYRLRYAKESWPEAVQEVRSVGPDMIVFVPDYISDAFNWYWNPGPERKVVGVPESGTIPDLGRARRAAVVLSHTNGQERTVLAHFDACCRRVESRLFPAQAGIRVYIYDAVLPSLGGDIQGP